MKVRRLPIVVAAVTGLVATMVAVAPQALAAAPGWEPDANGNGGTLSLYNAAGVAVTGGNDLSHLFDYAVASTSEDPASSFHKASLAFAFPNHLQPTSAWFVNGQSAANAYPIASGPGSITGLPATTPVAHPGPTDMNLTAALGGGTLDNSAGYANIIQIRMAQSGASFSYWTADIQFDTVAGTWTEVYPTASSAVSTTTSLAVSPATHQTGGSPVALTATVTPAAAVGSIQFKDGAVDLGAPVAVASGTAHLTTSALAAGAHSLTAVFSPTDPTAFAASSSSAVAYSVKDASSLTISRSVTVRYGAAITTSATLKDTRSGHAVAGVPVKLYGRTSTTATWSLVGTVATSSKGVASKAVRPTRRTYYQWRYAGSSSLNASTSPTQTVSVSQVVTAAVAPSTVKHGKSVKVYGTVAPSSSGQKVTLQRLVGRSWRNVATVTIKRQKLPNRKTTIGFVFTVKLAKKGTYAFRVYKPATSALLAGYSSTLHARAT